MDNVVYTACIELQPITKKNSQRILNNSRTGRPFVAPSETYKRYEAEARIYLSYAIIHKLPNNISLPGLPIDYPVNIQAIYYRSDRRRVDLPNLHEALCDVLVTHGILKDDNFNIVASMDGSEVRYDKEKPRTEIIITRK